LLLRSARFSKALLHLFQTPVLAIVHGAVEAFAVKDSL